MSASTDQREAQLDREVERIMKLTPKELEAELRAEGRDLHEEAERARRIIERALASVKRC